MKNKVMMGWMVLAVTMLPALALGQSSEEILCPGASTIVARGSYHNDSSAAPSGWQTPDSSERSFNNNAVYAGFKLASDPRNGTTTLACRYSSMGETVELKKTIPEKSSCMLQLPLYGGKDMCERSMGHWDDRAGLCLVSVMGGYDRIQIECSQGDSIYGNCRVLSCKG